MTSITTTRDAVASGVYAYSLEEVATTQTIWMLFVLGATLLLGLFSVEAFFTLSFVGLLAVTQLYHPTGESPGWWRWLRLLTGICFLVFGYVVYRQVLSVI